MVIDHGEGYLCLPGLHDDVTTAAHDHRSRVIFQHSHRGDVVDEIDFQEGRHFRLGKVASHGEEAAIERLGTETIDGGEKAGAVVGPEGTDLQPSSIPQRLDRRKLGCVQADHAPIIRSHFRSSRYVLAIC